jgi:hypothetical protein
VCLCGDNGGRKNICVEIIEVTVYVENLQAERMRKEAAM